MDQNELPTLIEWLSSQKSAQLYITAEHTFKLRLYKNGRYDDAISGKTFEDVIRTAMKEPTNGPKPS